MQNANCICGWVGVTIGWEVLISWTVLEPNTAKGKDIVPVLEEDELDGTPRWRCHLSSGGTLSATIKCYYKCQTAWIAHLLMTSIQPNQLPAPSLEESVKESVHLLWGAWKVCEADEKTSRGAQAHGEEEAQEVMGSRSMYCRRLFIVSTSSWDINTNVLAYLFLYSWVQWMLCFTHLCLLIYLYDLSLYWPEIYYVSMLCHL